MNEDLIPRPHIQSRRQRGQALTEFIALCIALVPLFLLFPLIGKYQDIAHSVLAASRYVAFDMLTRYNNPKPQAQLEQEVRRRFFSAAALPIKSNDSAGDFTADQNPLWRDPINKPLISNFNDIQVSTQWTTSSNWANESFNTAASLLDLSDRGLYTATITAPIANLPAGLRFYEPFDKLNLQIQRHTSIVPDTWAAGSAAQVQSKLGGPLLVPLSKPLQALSPFVDLWMLPVEPGVRPPKLGQLQFWADQVPADRLK